MLRTAKSSRAPTYNLVSTGLDGLYKMCGDVTAQSLCGMVKSHYPEQEWNCQASIKISSLSLQIGVCDDTMYLPIENCAAYQEHLRCHSRWIVTRGSPDKCVQHLLLGVFQFTSNSMVVRSENPDPIVGTQIKITELKVAVDDLLDGDAPIPPESVLHEVVFGLFCHGKHLILDGKFQHRRNRLKENQKFCLHSMQIKLYDSFCAELSQFMPVLYK